jgi:DivIVA domain-containing protein
LSEHRRVPAAIRNVAFPVAVRGYERRAVDAYVTRVNRAIAELEATRSPQDAVDRALERTQEERSNILAQARGRAADIAAAAHREAEKITAEARAEAADIVVNASADADRTKADADAHVAQAGVEAEQILADSRTEAAGQLRRAQEEITKLRNEAEEWLQELRADTETIWSERRDLVDDLREIAARLQAAVSKIRKRAGDASTV